MKQDFLITHVGGEQIEVSAGLVDMVRTERHLGTSIASMGDNPSIEAISFLAYSAARRGKKAGQDFDAWLETVEAIDLVEAGTDPKASQD